MRLYLRKTLSGGHMIFSSGEIYQSLVKTIEAYELRGISKLRVKTDLVLRENLRL